MTKSALGKKFTLEDIEAELMPEKSVILKKKTTKIKK
jgi:hypothetical protein